MHSTAPSADYMSINFFIHKYLTNSTLQLFIYQNMKPTLNKSIIITQHVKTFH